MRLRIPLGRSRAVQAGDRTGVPWGWVSIGCMLAAACGADEIAARRSAAGKTEHGETGRSMQVAPQCSELIAQHRAGSGVYQWQEPGRFRLRSSRPTGTCFGPDAEVYHASGTTMRMDEITSGDVLLSYSHPRSDTIGNSVREVEVYPDQGVCRLTVERQGGGREAFDVTPSHPFYASLTAAGAAAGRAHLVVGSLGALIQRAQQGARVELLMAQEGDLVGTIDERDMIKPSGWIVSYTEPRQTDVFLLRMRDADAPNYFVHGVLVSNQKLPKCPECY